MSRFLFVIDCLGSGGAQRQLISIAKELKLSGYEVDFFIYYDHLNHFKPALEALDIKIITSVKKSRFSLKPIWSLYRLITSQRYQGVLAFMQTPAQYVAFAKLMAKNLRREVPVTIFSERTTYSSDKPLSLLFKVSQQLHRTHDFIVANSHHQREKMSRAFPWMKSKLSTIYNGLDTQTFRSREAIAKRSEQPYLLCVSRVVPYKNYQNLARALVILKERFNLSPKVVWVGKVFPEANNLALLEEVKGSLQKAGVAEQMEFVGEKSDVATYYEKAHALIHPSLIEGFSNVVMEATRYGLPLLLGNIGDHQRFCQEYKAGYVFDVYDPNDIAEKIFTLLNTSDFQQDCFSKESRRASDELFVIKQSANAYLSLLTRGINAKGC